MEKEPAKLTEEQTMRLCRTGHVPTTCSFLVYAAKAGWVCAKGSDLEPMINDRRARKDMVAMGNNCSGPPDFTPLYDRPD